jgi:hypothetical protein
MSYWISLGVILLITYALIKLEERVNDGEN